MSESRSHKRHKRYRSFYLAVVVGLAAFALSVIFVSAQAITVGSIAFFIVYLAMTLRAFPGMSAKFLKLHAAEADAPVTLIFGATLVVVVAAVFSLFQLINSGGPIEPLRMAGAVLAVILGWFMIHAMAAHHYAYEYYAAPEVRNEGDDGSAVVGGLDFPTGKEPGGTSFLYFSFVIGMTAQVADVAITSVHMQRLVALHGIFSFFFNTLIIAATVNLVVNLGS